MAKKTKADAPPDNAGRAWLVAQLAAAEDAVARGPGGEGWRFNESKRAEVEAHAHFLRGLLALVDAALKESKPA